MKVSSGGVDSNLFKSWSPERGCCHNGGLNSYIGIYKNHFAIEAKTCMEASSSGVQGFATGVGSNIEIRIFRKKLGEKTSLKPYI